ncbi:hypothetical protein ASE63_00095 [Bosea sp. Root381]|uniref:ABC transporter permease n=1 Tax=Bosea sp. Root381 TaxID=1736524 RepID=UPI0006F6E145|nr:ABC transporter permease [Bosea sp. Root381]KRE17651.1 hypothetical protein ASE63_00095 [Bosea sp. Root381]
MPEVSVWTRLDIQRNVIAALMIRYLMARYGRGNLGFLWVVVEPIFLVGGIIAVWSLLYPGTKHGLNLASFVLASYIPLTLWRHLSSSANFMSANAGLLYHRRITVHDILIARALTEIAAVSAAAVLVYLVLLSVGVVQLVEDPSMILLGWLAMCAFGFSAGHLIAGLSEKSEAVVHLIQPAQYLLLPLSGVFYMVSWLPKGAQEYALLVPQVHIFEMIRSGMFGDAVETHYSVWYIAIWSTVQMALGFWAVDSSRKRLKTR